MDVEENNNNNNYSTNNDNNKNHNELSSDEKKMNKPKSKSHVNDEIIEEFDFSDCDLEAMDNDNVDDAGGVRCGGDNGDSDSNNACDNMKSVQNVGNEVAVASRKCKNNNNQQQKQQRNNKHKNKCSKSTDKSNGAQMHDNNITKAIVTDKCGGGESSVTATTAAKAMPPAIGATSDNNHSTVSSTEQRKIKPSNLELCEGADTEATTTADSYCPITPRQIMDIEMEEPAAAMLLRSDTKSNVQEREQSNGNQPAIPNSIYNDADAHYSDNGDPDNPDAELLVQFLGEANSIAEARLAARRQARAEAREIRMRELERQQKEQEQNADRVFDMQTASGIDPLSRSRLAAGVGSSPLGSMLNSTRGTSMSSRRSSEDSLEEEGRSLRDIRHELKDVEERFRKAMIANAQLDNERASHTYQIQLLKDKLEEMEESYAQLQREFKEKSRDYNALKRNLDKLNEELRLVQGQLHERDGLIAEQGLVIVAVENEDGTDAKRALVSVENAQFLGSVQGSLDVRLKKFNDEKQQLVAEVQQLQEQLENYKSQGKGRGSSMNGPLSSDEDYEAQREANKIISDYKYKLQKAEQEIASLQASLARSETQVIRYKSTAEAAEKAEADLKIERRKLQRENREAMERLEELETSNNHLLKRLDKLKNAKSALLKDL